MADRTADLCYAVWATAWGPMGAVAGPAGLCRVLLPHYQFDEAVAILAWKHPEARRDDEAFERLIELTRSYFNARPVSFDEILCDLPGPGTFAGQVHREARRIPYARTLSYSALAGKMGRPDAARAVAGAMSRNPLPLIVPCHRVIHADGRAGGFSAPGGIEQKRRMLELEARAAAERPGD